MNFRGFVLITSTLLLLLQGCSTKSTEVAEKKEAAPQPAANDVLTEIDRLERDSKLDKLRDSDTLCSINDTPLTMGEYRRQLNAQLQQFQNTIMVNPSPELKFSNRPS